MMAETRTRAAGRTVVLAILGIALLWISASPASASYVHKYQSSFPASPAGTPTTVAIDEQTGDVYTVTTEGKLEKFDSSGAPSNFSIPGANWIQL